MEPEKLTEEEKMEFANTIVKLENFGGFVVECEALPLMTASEVMRNIINPPREMAAFSGVIDVPYLSPGGLKSFCKLMRDVGTGHLNWLHEDHYHATSLWVASTYFLVDIPLTGAHPLSAWFASGGREAKALEKDDWRQISSYILGYFRYDRDEIAKQMLDKVPMEHCGF